MVDQQPPPSAPYYPATPETEGAHIWDYLAIVLRRRRAVIATFLVVAGLMATRTLLMKPVYRATAQVLIERENLNVVNFKEVSQVDAARDDYYQTQYKLLQSRALAARTIVALNLLNDPEFGGPRSAEEIEAAKAAEPGTSALLEKSVNIFLARLAVQPIRNSRLVMVSFESGRPELAAAIVNRHAQHYIKQTLEFRYQTSAEAGQWLGTQVDEQRKKVTEADEAMQTLKEQEGIVNIEERRTLLDQKLKELGTTLNGLKSTRLQREALVIQMRGAPNPEELPEVMRNGVVQSLRIELANLERQQANLLEKYLDQHPEVIRVRNQITETRRKISVESQAVIHAAENDYRAALAQEQSVAGALEAAKAEALDLDRRSVVYDSVKREVDAQKQVLNGLLSRSKETDVSTELKSSNIRIVDAASLPSNPVRPRRVRDIALGLILGLGLGVGMAFLLDYLDNTVKTPQDIRMHLGAPLLAVIPESPSVGDALVLTSGDVDSRFAETYRALRTSLHYCWPERSPRILLVTSTFPGEGKSLTSVNLALSLAATDDSVLLIDADMRKSRCHTLLKRTSKPGLSDVLVGKSKFSETVQTNIAGNLSFLPAGTSVPSPVDLLTSQALHGFLEGLRDAYTWVVLDAPPVGAVSEPLMLASFTDGVVVVIGAEMVARKAVRTTLERIAQSRGRVLGVALNRAQIEKHSYYYGGRYYGSYYGSYYGHYYGSYYGDKDSGKRSSGRKSGRVARIADARREQRS